MLQQKRSTSATNGVLHLTPEDVHKLLAAETGTQARIDVTSKVAESYSSDSFDARERLIAEQIFRLIVRDTETSVRAALAEQVKKSSALPRDIVMVMARDVEEVALPILHHSEVLTDTDLISIIESLPDTWRQVAVSERRVVSEALADSLLTKGKQEVAEALVKNSGAQLTEAALTHIFDRYGQQAGMAQVLAGRSGLPVAVAEKVVNLVSGALADSLRKKYDLRPEQLASEQERAREAGTIALLKQKETPEEVEKLVTQLHAFGRLTPALILASLCEGHVVFFEISMARLAGVPYENARKLINDRGDLGFRAIYNKSGLPSDMFGAVRALLQVVHELLDESELTRGGEFSNRALERLMQIEDEQEIPNLPYIIALLRKGAQ